MTSQKSVEEPSFTIKASSKFSSIALRLLADMMFNLSDSQVEQDMFLELCELSGEMETWRQANPDKCVS
jgi:hypothetical protein